MGLTKLKKGFANALATRLELVLSTRTGGSLSEVELNPQFILTAKLLVQNCKPTHEDSKHQNFILEIIQALVELLSSLNIDQNTGKLLERDDKTLLSTLVVTKVLKSAILANWNPEEQQDTEAPDLLVHNGIDFNFLPEVSNDSLEIYTYPIPDKLQVLVFSILEVLLTVVSNEVNHRAISVLRRTPEVPLNIGDFILPSSTLTPEDARAHLIKIDSNILLVLKYIALCNPYDYYSFLYEKLFLWSEKGEYIPSSALQKYSHLLMHIYFTLEVTEPFLRHMYSSIPFVRSSTWMQLFLYYGSWSLQYQFIYRPGFYSTVVYAGSLVDQSCKALFDFVSSVLEDDLSLSLSLFSWYVLTCPSDFHEMLHKPKKLKVTFNKRVRFLMSILKEAQLGTNLDKFECMANIFLLGSVIEDPKEPVREFSERYLDEVYAHLLSLKSQFFLTSQGRRYGQTVVRFTTAAMFLKPEKYIPFFSDNFDDLRDQLRTGNRDICVLSDYKTHLATIEYLLREKLFKATFEAVMEKMSSSLTNILNNVCIVVRRYDQLYRDKNRSDAQRSLENSISRSSTKSTLPLRLDSRSESSNAPSPSKMTRFDSAGAGATVSASLSATSGNFPPTSIAAFSGADSSYSGSTSLSAAPGPTSASGYTQDTSPRIVYKTSSFIYVDQDFSQENMDLVEEILAAILNAFAAAPQFYLVRPANADVSGLPKSIEWMQELVAQAIAPIKLAILFKSTRKSNSCFDAACNLARKLLRPNNGEEFCHQRQCLSFLISIEVMAAASEVLLQLSGDKFQKCFMIFNRFLHDRYRTFWQIKDNPNLASEWAHTRCKAACNAYEVILLYALCTHDVQFFNLAKASMRYYVLDLSMPYHHTLCTSSTLARSFERILNDNSVFTGFVSLHKKFRAVLIDAEPTDSLYQVWLLIYKQWLRIVDDENAIAADDHNSMFRHYTGFLMCTAGCFTDPAFAKSSQDKFDHVMTQIHAFFDCVIELIYSGAPLVRVVMKDSLSTETPSALFTLIGDKLISKIVDFVSRNDGSEEAFTFVDETFAVFTTMMASKTDGAFALAGMLPKAGQANIQFIALIKDPVDQIRLKLRMCKLGIAIESDFKELGLTASHKLRNFFARAVLDWLEAAVFYNDDILSTNTPKETRDASFVETGAGSSIMGATATGTSTDQLSLAADSLSAGGRTTDMDYLQMELAFECSKCMSLQLKLLVLDIPNGTTESKVDQARNFVFLHYFLLFYRVLQKFTTTDQQQLAASGSVQRSKYKVQGIVENVLLAFSNVLKADSNIGMPFALPLGYHENKKIRAIFLRIFATMLSTRKKKLAEEEFPEDLVVELSEVYDVFSAAADIASPSEHNLLATSLHGLYSYTKKLDKLFETLLRDEVEKVSRASDIFRGNSCLTRLMSILAKDYGVPYLTVVLRPFIEEMVENETSVEVEKTGSEEDVDVFIDLLQRLVDSIVNSMPWVPDAFKYICAKIYESIESKFGDAVLIAVGSFIFLRFFCPAIVSPESSFDMPALTPKVKRSLIQIVKVIQYMANGSLANLKWAKLAPKMEIMEEMNRKIFDFLRRIALQSTYETYPFLSLTRKPCSSLRYLHKFFYTYFPEIRARYFYASKIGNAPDLRKKIVTWKKVDYVFLQFGAPKFSISLQGSKSFKVADPSNVVGTSQFLEFMAKISAKNIEMSLDTPVVHTSVFHDGTPVVVANFRHIREIGYDINTFVYMLLDVASQVWDNKFYIVLDFTRFFFVGILGKNYISLMTNYAPKIFFLNCARTYYYNLPRTVYLPLVENMIQLRKSSNEKNKVYFYTQQDDPEIINSLCLEESVRSINQDVRAIYKNCQLYDDATGLLTPVTIKFGRKWLQLCYPRAACGPDTVTRTVAPVETHMITDITTCEVSNKLGLENEFTLTLNRYNYQVTLISPQRPELLRSLYFAMLRNQKETRTSAASSEESEREISNRLNVLIILVFHGLLERDDEIRAAAAQLFTAIDSYFDLHLGLSPVQTDKVTFPIDTTDFIVTVSTHLAAKKPEYTYAFLKAFFAHFTKLPEDLRLSGILYISPWLDNVGRHVVTGTDGAEKMASIIRLFCHMTIQNKNFAPILNDKIWKKLFDEMSLIHILVEEIVSFAIDNIADVDTLCTIISMVTPSVELCGEVVSRINNCIAHTNLSDSEIAIQGKQLEITILVKVCGSVFFNSYVYGLLYLPDVFSFCTLFIDNPGLEFGSDLQKLVINTLRAFSQNPKLTQSQNDLIDSTVDYFSSQRAKMLFGLTSRERATHWDAVQSYNRAMSFELLCDNLHDFICQMGSADEKTRWLLRWLSLSMDIAFGNSLFQRRALMVVCTLARLGISDSTGGKILKLVSSMLLTQNDFSFDCMLCYCRLEQGFTSDSVYLPLLVWLVFCSVFLVQPATYQATIHCIGNIMKHMSPEFLRRIMTHRQDLGPLLSKFEQKIGVTLDIANFEPAILFAIAKGLTSSQFRHNSLVCLSKVLSFKFPAKLGHKRTNGETESEPDEEINSEDIPENSKVSKLQKRSELKDFEDNDDDNFGYFYLLVLFLSTSDSKFRSHLSDLSLENLPMTNLNQDEIPTVLIDNLCANTPRARFVAILLAHIYKSDLDHIFKSRFVSLFSYIYKHHRETALLIVHIISEELERNVVSSTSIGTVTEISNLLVQMMENPHYSEEKYVRQVVQCLRELNFSKIDQVGELTSSSDHEVTLLLKLMLKMIYRTFCNAFEGLKLENF